MSFFGLDNLPYGCVRRPGGHPVAAVRLADDAVPIAPLLPADLAALFGDGSLDAFLAAGPEAWRQVRELVTARAADAARVPLTEVECLLPFRVADYVDFYSSEHHASNVGKIFRPDGPPLTPNWKHQPIGYHGRAGTIVVSGTPVRRPLGQTRGASGDITFGPSARLDFEAEVAFIVGVGSRLGTPVPLSAFREHVFGVCLLNDWSARDIQSFEYVPLGPFLGKSFATSLAAWITPLEALDAAWTAPPPRDPAPLPYLADEHSSLDLNLTVSVGEVELSRPRFADMYWTAPQQLAHLTSNGASLRTGDVYASGTVSGAQPDQRGCLLELTWNEGPWLADGDEVIISATAPGRDGRIALGEVRGRIEPAGT